MTKRRTDQKEKVSKVKIFPVPIALGEIEENIIININTPNTPSQEQIIEKTLQQAIAAHKEGNTQKAESIYRTILQSHPLNPVANYSLALLAVSANQTDAALPLFKTALAASPKTEQFWLGYIDALIKGNQTEVAKQVIEQAKKQGVKEDRLDELNMQLKSTVSEKMQLKPTDAEINILLLAYQNRQFDEAEKLAVSLSERFPKHPFSWKVLGALLQKTGRIIESLIPMQKSVDLEPQDYTAHFNLGITLQKIGRLQEAQESYKQAVALKPDYAEAFNNLGVALKELGRLEEAQENYKQAIGLKPDFPEANNNLGVALKELGRLEEAEASYKQSIALKPDYAEAHSNLGGMLKGIGRFEESVYFNQKAFAHRTGIRPVGDESLSPATTSIYIELTNKCNFHCTFCPSDSQKRLLGTMDLDLVKQLYEENAGKKIARVVNLHLMGEPTLHPDLIEILKFGSYKNIKTDLVTNISTLGPKNVSKILDALYGTIIASHMSPTEDTYHVRGAVGIPWERYIGNLRLLVREYMKRIEKGNVTKNTIDIRVMVTQNTASNVSIIGSSKEAGDILKEWNDFVAEVEFQLGMPPFERKDHNDDDLVRGNKYSQTSYYLQKGIKLSFWRAFTFANTRVSDNFDLKRTRQDSYCPHPFTDVGVLWNGDVTLCCLDHDGQLKVGNVRDSSIETVIQSEAAKKLRASMLGKSPLPSICQTCQERPIKRDA